MRMSVGAALARWGSVAAVGLVIAVLSPRFFLVAATAAGIGWLCWTGADPVHARPAPADRSTGEAGVPAPRTERNRS